MNYWRGLSKASKAKTLLIHVFLLKIVAFHVNIACLMVLTHSWEMQKDKIMGSALLPIKAGLIGVISPGVIILL